MSDYNTVINGSFAVLDGEDTALYGFGDFYINRNLETHGTVQLLSVSDSLISVAGGNLSLTTSDTGNVIINSVGAATIDGAQVSIDATSDSTVSVTGGDLTLSTATSGNVVVSAVDAATVDAGSISLDATSDSNFSVANNDLTLSTTTAGNVSVSAADTASITAASDVDINAGTVVTIDGPQVSIDATSDSNVSVTGGDLTLSTITSGNVVVTAVDAATVDAGSVSLDATSDSNFSVANNNLTLSTTTAGNVVVTAADAVDVNGTNVTVDATSAISLDAAAASNFTVAGANLTVATTTSGNVALSAADTVSLTAVSDVDINAGTIVTIDGPQVSIDATSDSNFTVAGANLTLSTATSGDVIVSAVDAATVDAGSISLDATSDSNFSVANNNLTLSTTTAGNVVVTAADAVDVNGTNVTVDATSAISLDAAAASNFTVAGANLTLATTTSGDVAVTAANNVALTAGSDMDLTTQSLDVNAVTFAVDGTSDSAINVTSGDLTLSTTTAGTVVVNSAGAVDIDGAAASSFNVTGADLTLSTTTSGNMSISSAGTATIAASSGVTVSNDTTMSSDLTVNNDFSVLGNATISGDLTVNGTTTTINTETLLIEDNLIGMNNAPAAAGRDSGIHLARHPSDVTQDTAAASGTAQTGTVSDVTLAAGASGTDDAYNDWYISITGGTGSGQIRQITDYVGTTKVAIVASDWSTAPDATSTYSLFNRPYTALVYDESADEWVIGYTADPASSATVSISGTTEYGTLHVGNLVVENAISGGNIFNEVVQVVDNASTRSNITNTDFRGSYFIIVESSDQGGACATFVASCRSSDVAGQVNRLTESRSATSERIQAEWTANNRVQLYHQTTKSGGTGANLLYKVVVTKAQ